ncbi:hypoxanthine phosphoribosyltransferase [Alkalidesulfovibrio alkalitolerans DSM 16529]|uniref:Hypoxanthine phosphoribosyltransferase n=1 Tax=Alkalidesulfovibrio alkalitolerans DSM 16529 TaxID=1121439 RepID=S7TE97_9BACT|nr:hypoxanthine phosphoribosyltransferase [Alkalidesulfovibrio alkalitolerans]EPR34905.1 hypoxanthine phosphoribosyltransferase [Alkalidesulfovibrio alkalitolerans DSM 16529]
MNLPPHMLRSVIPAEAIARRVAELGRTISERYMGEPLVAVCVLKGATLFFADLVRRLTCGPELDYLQLASYAGGTSSTGRVVFRKDMDVSVEDKHVLVVEDIVDSGKSMEYLLKVLSSRKPRSVALAALIDKHERREAAVTVDFPGFTLNEGFVVGYGMDYAERYRELPHVAEVIFTN